MCPGAPRQDPEPPKETAMEALPAHSRHRGSPCGDFGVSVSSRKQTCPWMHSQAPAAQEDTCPPAKQGPPAHTCHTSPGDAADVHQAPTAALCAGPHSAPENGLHQIEQKLLELPVPRSSLIPSSREARTCSGPSCLPPVGRSLCLWPLECPPR